MYAVGADDEYAWALAIRRLPQLPVGGRGAELRPQNRASFLEAVSLKRDLGQIL